MAERIDVFISSTSRDLTAYRDAVTKVILRLGLHPIIMEAFNPTDRNALQLCYDKVQEAEIFIGIYAHRYGYAPGSDVTYTLPDGTIKTGDGETGITHLEYLWAIERKLPMLLFVISDTDADDNPLAWPVTHIEDEPGKSRLKSFKILIMGKHVVGFFHSPDHLATQVATGLAELKLSLQSSSERYVDGTPKRSDFYKHIQLPPNYVPRSELIAELRLGLLDDEGSPIANKGITALHGMGGIGKSVMARALCDDPVIRTAYPDGILWTTLGQEPNIALKLREWVDALDGTIRENAPTVDSLKAVLAELLADRAFLLVVDDVWQKKHGEVFRVGGENSHLLVTTRDAEVARNLGAIIQPIPAMSLPESIDLLKEWAGDNLVDTDESILRLIITRLGRLPLAIKLAGAQLQHKSPEKWLERFDARKLEEKRGGADDPHSSLERCFGMSLSELKEAERKLYAALTIFKEDEPIREVAVAKLWSALDDFDDDDTEELLDDLAARALLEIVGTEYPRAAVLHDLMRDFIAVELDDAQATHVALLEAYHEMCANGWHTGPNDGYFFEHLPYHLFHSKNNQVLIALLSDIEWMQAKLSVCNISSLLADFDLISDRHEISLIKEAILLSSSVLSSDGSQLAGQLLGRLLNTNTVAEALIKAKTKLSFPWLRPMKGSITSPGSALLRIFTGHSGAVRSIKVETEGRYALSTAQDQTIRIWNIESGVELGNLGSQRIDPPVASFTSDGQYVVSAFEYVDPESKVQILPTVEGRSTIHGRPREHYLRIWHLKNETFRIIKTNHKNTINDIIMIPKTNIIITASGSSPTSSTVADYSIRLWDFVHGEEILALQGHEGPIRAIAVTSDGKYVVSGSDDQTIKVWNIENGIEVMSLRGHKAQINCVRFFLDEKRIVSASGNFLGSDEPDNTIRIWDMETGKEMLCLSGHAKRVNSVAIFPDNQRVISAADDGTARLWDLSEGKELYSLKMHTSSIVDVAVVPDGSRVISASYDGKIKVWDSSRLEELTQRRSSIHVHVSETERAISRSLDRIQVWNLESGEEIFSMDLPILPPVLVEPSGKHFIYTTIKNEINFLNLHDGTLESSLAAHSHTINAMTLTRDSAILVSASSDNTIKVWDIKERKLKHDLREHLAPVVDVVVTPNGNRLISASEDKTVKIWCMKTGSLLSTIEDFRFYRTRIGPPIFLPLQDSTKFLSTSFLHGLQLRLFDSGELLIAAEKKEPTIFHKIMMTNSGDRVIAIAGDVVKVYDIGTLREIFVFNPYTMGEVTDIAITPDDGLVLASISEHVIIGWSLVTGEERLYLKGHYDTVNDVIISHDGRRAITASYDGMIAVWDLESGNILAKFNGDEAIVSSQLSQDGKTIIAGTAFGRVHLLRMEGI